MDDLALFSIASDRNRWLATRGAALADNIANADTPGFKARDVPSFEAALNSANAAMLRTNTNHLAHLCREYTTTYHIADATCIDPDSGTIRHKPELAADAPEVVTRDWLPMGPASLGLTAGASTPNNKIGETIERILANRKPGVPQPF